jgi:hypothetical protein
MRAIGRKVLSLLVLVSIAVAPLGCVTVNRSPAGQPARTDVNVGGSHGVTVNKSSSSDYQPSQTDVNVGGSHGVTVEHRDTD